MRPRRGSRAMRAASETAARRWSRSALLWVLPLAYAFWTAFHPAEFSTHFVLAAPLTFDNFVTAWNAAPFARYFVNTVLLVAMILAAQLVLVTLAAYAFARFEFPGRGVLFALVLIQLMVMPDVLIVENYRTMGVLGLKDTILAIGLPYMASASASSCCARRSRPCRGSSTRRRGWRAAPPLGYCGRCTCRSRAPSISPMRWSASATTGTISCGR